MDRFRTTFTLCDNTHPQRRRTVRTEETIAAVEQSVEEDQNESIRHRAQQLELCPSTLWKMKIGPVELALFEPAAAATCPKSYLNINGIKLSFQ